MFSSDTIILSVILTSLILSVLSIGIACISISAIIGFKNSTHKIEWKPLPVEKLDDDPFKSPTEVAASMENPLKKKIKNPFPVEEVKEDEPFADLDDPNVESHHWG